MKKLLGTALVAVALSIASVSTVQAKRMGQSSSAASAPVTVEEVKQAQMSEDEQALKEFADAMMDMGPDFKRKTVLEAKLFKLAAEKATVQKILKAERDKNGSRLGWIGSAFTSADHKAEVARLNGEIKKINEKMRPLSAELKALNRKLDRNDEGDNSYLTGRVAAAGALVMGAGAFLEYVLRGEASYVRSGIAAGKNMMKRQPKEVRDATREAISRGVGFDQ